MIMNKTQGGAWCNTTEDCSDRKMTDLGSSKFMKAIEFEGILSNKRSQNSFLYVKEKRSQNGRINEPKTSLATSEDRCGWP